MCIHREILTPNDFESRKNFYIVGRQAHEKKFRRVVRRHNIVKTSDNIGNITISQGSDFLATTNQLLEKDYYKNRNEAEADSELFKKICNNETWIFKVKDRTLIN